MQVTARIGKNGSMIAVADGLLMIFDNEAQQPLPGETLDVMITHHTARKSDGGIGALIVRPLTKDDILVRHLGFIQLGGPCVSTAMIAPDDQRRLRRAGAPVVTLTSGRTPVIKVRPVGANGVLKAPAHGAAYVANADIADGLNRICGVPDLAQIEPGAIARLRAGKKNSQSDGVLIPFHGTSSRSAGALLPA